MRWCACRSWRQEQLDNSAVRRGKINLLEPVLRLPAETVADARLDRPFVKVAGILGPTEQAVAEAKLARSLGYDLGLLSMGGLPHLSEADLIRRACEVADYIPIFGFYLQPAVGGRRLSYEFWTRFAAIPGVMAIKIAAFDRYQTLDVVRAVCGSVHGNEIALYTGNDDNLVADLLTPYRFADGGKVVEKYMAGGLLGHWAFWTRRAVELLEEIKQVRGQAVPAELLARGVEVTDANAAVFDPGHAFHGCIPGIHEILRRQGLLEGRWCLDPAEELSIGQIDEIDRVIEAYPHLNDDAFVRAHLAEWLN